ncbi:MAG: hypothetical protein ACOZAO_01220 [Patescibacteria group bacterium]
MVGNKLNAYIKNYLYLDLRSLALARIGIGFIIIFDLAIRYRQLEDHYTINGVMPNSVRLKALANPLFSIHNLNESAAFQTILFIAAGLVAFTLLVGFKTKISTIVSWLLLVSLQNRNELILFGGDMLLAMTLFWGMFLPWGKKFSVDALKNKTSETKYVGIAGIGFILQVSYLYILSAIFKTNEMWTTEGSATYYALTSRTPQKPWVNLLIPHADILQIATYLIYVLELVGPFFIFLPIFKDKLRFAVVSSLIALHVGLISFMFLLFFPILNITVLMALLPSIVWKQKPDTNNFVQDQKWKNILAFAFIAFFYYLNLNSFNSALAPKPQIIAQVERNFRLRQKWVMYARPPHRSEWVVVKGKTQQGNDVDLKQGTLANIDYSRPKYSFTLIPQRGWVKFEEVLKRDLYPGQMDLYTRFWCEKWNKNNEDKIETLELINVYQEYDAATQSNSEIKQELLKTTECSFNTSLQG